MVSTVASGNVAQLRRRRRHRDDVLGHRRRRAQPHLAGRCSATPPTPSPGMAHNPVPAERRRPAGDRPDDVRRHHAAGHPTRRGARRPTSTRSCSTPPAPGGQSMEKLVDSGMITAVLDMTTTEIADLVVGGVFPAGPTVSTRSPAPVCPTSGRAARSTWSTSAPLDTVPERFAGSPLHVHNPQVTLMRTTADENVAFGELHRRQAQRVRRARCGSCCPRVACR